MRTAILLGVLLVAVTATRVHAQPADDEAARKERDARAAYAKGTAHFNLGEYAEAAEAFRTAYELSQEPGLLFNLGQAYRLKGGPGSCTAALHAYQSYLRLDPKGRNRATAERHLPALEVCAGKEQAERPEPVEPPRPLQVTPPPPAPTPARIDDTPRTGGWRRPAGWTALGLGAAGLVAGGITGVLAIQKGNELEGPCSAGCPPELHDDNDRYNALRTWTTVGLVVGAVGAVSGTYLLWSSRGGDHRQAAVVTTGSSIALRGTF